MKNKTFWIGFVAVFIVVQVIEYLVHGVALMDTYEQLADAFRPQEQMFDMMWMMTVASLIYLLAFCYIFTKGYEGKGIAEGVRYGAWMGLFLAPPMAINQYVVYRVPGDVAAIWFVTILITMHIAGAVFAAIYKPQTAST